MLKGSGDFIPKEVPECPDSCPYYTPDRGYEDYCQYPHGCYEEEQGEMFRETLREARREVG